METMGPFSFTVREEQVVAAMKRLMLARAWKGPIRWILILIAALLALLVVLDFLMTGEVSKQALAFMVAVPVALAIVYFWIAPMMGRRQYRQSAALRAESTIAWDDEAVMFSGERGYARLPLAEFHRFAVSPDMLMLYQTEMYFNLVPLTALGDAAGDLVAKLEAAGVKRV
ncbi:YcxB family protein [Croceicoccus sediminis]|uniref:YcxB family protein n=1 Tax=Croceicoccus sediminis TaxID=2571150 RepID=UPI00118204F1|nr:YcxB family protein [Croceicoccus sediminis]